MVAVSTFGSFEGKRVDQFTLTSDTGVEVDILSWGVVVRDWRVPVAGGKRSVVLGFPQFDNYPQHSPYFGAVVGRVANRIGGAKFELGGKTYAIAANEKGNTLHGGPEGWGRLVWDAAPDLAGLSEAEFEHFAELQQQVANAGSRHAADDAGDREAEERFKAKIVEVLREKGGWQKGRRPEIRGGRS